MAKRSTNRPDSITELDYELQGERMSLWTWSKELGFVYGTVLQRVNRGLSFAEAIEHTFHGRLPKRSPWAMCELDRESPA